MYLISTSKTTVLSDFNNLVTQSIFLHENGWVKDFQIYTHDTVFLEVNKKSRILDVIHVKDLKMERVRRLRIPNLFCVACAKRSEGEMALGGDNGFVKLYNNYKTFTSGDSFNISNRRERVVCLDYNCTDEYIASLIGSGEINLYSTTKPSELRNLNVINSTFTRFHPSKSYCLAVGSSNGTVTVYDINGEKEIFNHINAHTTPCMDLGMSIALPDMLISAGYDCVVNMFDTRRKSLAMQLKSDHPYSTGALSSCGKYLVVGTVKGELKSFDMRNLKTYLTLRKVHDGAVSRLSFVPHCKINVSDTSCKKSAVDERQSKQQESSPSPGSNCDFLDYQAKEIHRLPKEQLLTSTATASSVGVSSVDHLASCATSYCKETFDPNAQRDSLRPSLHLRYQKAIPPMQLKCCSGDLEESGTKTNNASSSSSTHCKTIKLSDTLTSNKERDAQTISHRKDYSNKSIETHDDFLPVSRLLYQKANPPRKLKCCSENLEESGTKTNNVSNASSSSSTHRKTIKLSDSLTLNKERDAQTISHRKDHSNKSIETHDDFRPVSRLLYQKANPPRKLKCCSENLEESGTKTNNVSNASSSSSTHRKTIKLSDNLTLNKERDAQTTSHRKDHSNKSIETHDDFRPVSRLLYQKANPPRKLKCCSENLEESGTKTNNVSNASSSSSTHRKTIKLSDSLTLNKERDAQTISHRKDHSNKSIETHDDFRPVSRLLYQKANPPRKLKCCSENLEESGTKTNNVSNASSSSSTHRKTIKLSDNLTLNKERDAQTISHRKDHSNKSIETHDDFRPVSRLLYQKANPPRKLKCCSENLEESGTKTNNVSNASSSSSTHRKTIKLSDSLTLNKERDAQTISQSNGHSNESSEGLNGLRPSLRLRYEKAMPPRKLKCCSEDSKESGIKTNDAFNLSMGSLKSGKQLHEIKEQLFTLAPVALSTHLNSTVSGDLTSYGSGSLMSNCVQEAIPSRLSKSSREDLEAKCTKSTKISSDSSNGPNSANRRDEIKGHILSADVWSVRYNPPASDDSLSIEEATLEESENSSNSYKSAYNVANYNDLTSSFANLHL